MQNRLICDRWWKSFESSKTWPRPWLVSTRTLIFVLEAPRDQDFGLRGHYWISYRAVGLSFSSSVALCCSTVLFSIVMLDCSSCRLIMHLLLIYSVGYSAKSSYCTGLCSFWRPCFHTFVFFQYHKHIAVFAMGVEAAEIMCLTVGWDIAAERIYSKLASWTARGVRSQERDGDTLQWKCEV